jgi:hypothetical protein
MSSSDKKTDSASETDTPPSSQSTVPNESETMAGKEGGCVPPKFEKPTWKELREAEQAAGEASRAIAAGAALTIRALWKKQGYDGLPCEQEDLCIEKFIATLANRPMF